MTLDIVKPKGQQMVNDSGYRYPRWFNFYFLGGVLVRFGTLTGACWVRSGVSVTVERIFFFFLPVRLSPMVQLLVGCKLFCLGLSGILFDEQEGRNLAEDNEDSTGIIKFRG